MDLDPLSSSAAPAPEKAADSSAGSALSGVRFREGQLDDLFPLMEIITKELSVGRGHLALATVSDAIKGGGAARIASLVAVHDGKVVAGTLATRIAEDAAQLIGFGCHDSIEPDQQHDLNRSLSEGLHQRLQDLGFEFVQARCEASDHTPPCAAVGYEWIATLDYLHSDLDTLLDVFGNNGQIDPSPPWQAAGLDCLPIDPRETTASWQRMVELVRSTYEQTLDCPRLNAFRSAADVVGAYVSASSFQPEGWRMISHNGRDIACLVTSVHPAANALEVTYMGISPSHRGRGIGKLLVLEAARIARKKGVDRIVLAVDRANQPARDLYRQCGFEHVGSEAVWGRKLSPASSCRLSGPTAPDGRGLSDAPS